MIAMDERIILLIGTLYILLSGIILSLSIRVYTPSEIVNEYIDSEKYKQLRNHNLHLTAFFLLTGELIWISLFMLMMIPKISMPDLVSRILATGIHVPFVFLFDGLLIKRVQKLILREWKITDYVINQSIFVITFFECVVLFCFNWEMSLFILAILIGKYIWLDSTSKELYSLFLRMLKSYSSVIMLDIQFKRDPFLCFLLMDGIDSEDKSLMLDMVGFAMMTGMQVFALISCIVLVLRYSKLH